MTTPPYCPIPNNRGEIQRILVIYDYQIHTIQDVITHYQSLLSSFKNRETVFYFIVLFKKPIGTIAKFLSNEQIQNVFQEAFLPLQLVVQPLVIVIDALSEKLTDFEKERTRFIEPHLDLKKIIADNGDISTVPVIVTAAADYPTPWAQDVINALETRGTRQSVLLKPLYGGRLKDRFVAEQLATQFPEFFIRPTIFNIPGGQVLTGRLGDKNYLVISEEYREIFITYFPELSDRNEQIKKVNEQLQLDWGADFIIWVPVVQLNLNGTITNIHLDYIAGLVGFSSGDKQFIVISEVVDDFVNDVDNTSIVQIPDLKESLENIYSFFNNFSCKEIPELSFEVIKVPIILDCRSNTIFFESYTNFIYEEYEKDKIIYLSPNGQNHEAYPENNGSNKMQEAPLVQQTVSSVKPLANQSVTDILRDKNGFKIEWVSTDPDQAALRLGALRCRTKVLQRKYKQ